MVSTLIEYWYVLLGGLGSIGTVAAWTIRRYQKSATKEIQPFLAYVLGNIRLSIGRRFSPVLARQFGLKTFADRSLATFPNHLAIPSVHRLRLELDKAYVRLSLTESPHRRIQDSEIFTDSVKSVLVFGEPGSGKSSLTKKLFREHCKLAYLHPFSGRLPIHVELRKLDWETLPNKDEELSDWLVEKLRVIVAEVQRLHDPDFLFKAFKEGPGIIVLLDGLDEVPSGALNRATKSIQGANQILRQASPGTVILVTARTQLSGLLSRDFQDSFDAILTVQPFSPADVFVFLRRWPFRDNRLPEARRIFERLRGNPTLFDMCTNPLVLSMYVAQDQKYADTTSFARLPDTRTDFYGEVVGELLLFRRQEQSGDVTGGSHLRKAREHLLGEIALDHLARTDDPANSVALNRAAEIVRTQLHLTTTEEAHRELQRLAVETGIFAEERAGESLRFMHLTLCEFLAGKELAESDDSKFLTTIDRISPSDSQSQGRGNERRLWETAIFALSLSARARRQSTLDRLREKHASDQFLLRAVREAQAYDFSIFLDVIDNVTNGLSKAGDDTWDSDWFSQVRLTLSCLGEANRLGEVLHYHHCPPRVGEWLDMLVGGDASKLDQLFDLYLATSPLEALRIAEEYGILDHILADSERIIDAMDHPDAVAHSVSKIMHNVSQNMRWVEHLGEAALRYELVAQILREETIPESLGAVADRVPRAHAWHKSGPLEGTLYGGVLALAIHNVSPPHEVYHYRKLRRVEILAEVDAANLRVPMPLRFSSLALSSFFSPKFETSSSVYRLLNLKDLKRESSSDVILMFNFSKLGSGFFARPEYVDRLKKYVPPARIVKRLNGPRRIRRSFISGTNTTLFTPDFDEGERLKIYYSEGESDVDLALRAMKSVQNSVWMPLSPNQARGIAT